jgi:predicted transglutaminase-like protease
MKTLISIFGWVPVLGQSLKIAYVAKCANEALSNVKMADEDQQNSSTEYISELADDLYDDYVEPEVTSLGLPIAVTEIAKKRAIKILSEGIKKKLLSN